MRSSLLCVTVLFLLAPAMPGTLLGGQGDIGVWGEGDGDWNQGSSSPYPWFDPYYDPPQNGGPGRVCNYVENGATVTIGDTAAGGETFYLGGSSRPFYGDVPVPRGPQSTVMFEHLSGVGVNLSDGLCIGADGPGAARFDHNEAGAVSATKVMVGCGVDGSGIC